MAIQVTQLERVFTFKKDGKEMQLKDPNPELTAQEVLKFYSGTYPELTNAMVEGPVVKNDKATYSMKTQAGKLG
jgi:PRTRC genetic system protein C